MADPRWYQIFALTFLLVYGKLAQLLDVGLAQIALTMSSVVLFQFVSSRAAALPRVEYKSALISGLSLCLLLRADALGWCVAAAAIAIVSKFVLRIGGKHVFNPTNLGIAVLLLMTDEVWVSPSQWGSTLILAFAVVCVGGMVVFRALRSDVTIAFLGSYAIALFSRALWLGDPHWIPFHQLQSGALLIFSFFMISDPKTTPSSRAGRILFAFLVTAVAYRLRFAWYEPNALIYSLVFCSIAVPLIDRLFGGERYDWSHPGRPRALQNLALGEA